MREEAHDAEPIIDRYEHDAMAFGKEATVEPELLSGRHQVASGSGHVRAPMDPDHDRRFQRRRLRRPDVEIEAVFVGARGRALARALRAGLGKLGLVAHAAPALVLDRRLPALLADRWLRERDLEKAPRAVHEVALHPTIRD